MKGYMEIWHFIFITLEALKKDEHIIYLILWLFFSIVFGCLISTKLAPLKAQKQITNDTNIKPSPTPPNSQ